MTTTTKNKTIKVVRFSEDPPVINLCPTRSELLESQSQNDLWYSKEEYQLIKKSYCFIVRMMERRQHLDEVEEMCSRGLETRTRIGEKRRRQYIEASLDAVFYEQECQWDEGFSNPRAIAAAYKEVSTESCMQAYINAQKDMKAVLADETNMDSIRTQSNKKGTNSLSSLSNKVVASVRVSNCTQKLHRQSSQSSIRSK